MKHFTERNMNGLEFLHQSGDDFAIETVADVEANIKRNKILQNDTDGYTASRDFRHVASIPLVVVEQWNNQYGVDVMAKDNRKLLKRLLNDPDNRLFRTSLGEF